MAFQNFAGHAKSKLEPLIIVIVQLNGGNGINGGAFCEKSINVSDLPACCGVNGRDFYDTAEAFLWGSDSIPRGCGAVFFFFFLISQSADTNDWASAYWGFHSPKTGMSEGYILFVMWETNGRYKMVVWGRGVYQGVFFMQTLHPTCTINFRDPVFTIFVINLISVPWGKVCREEWVKCDGFPKRKKGQRPL